MLNLQQPHLTGTLTNITANSQSTTLLIKMHEHLDQDDSALGKTPLGETHQIRLSGSWVKLVQDDFKVTLSVTFYLNRHQPRFSSAMRRWEFGSGIRADLTMRDGDQQSVIKMIDVAASDSGRSASASKAYPNLSMLSDGASDTENIYDSPTNLWPRKRPPSPDAKPDPSQPSQLKRPCSTPRTQQSQPDHALPSSTEKPRSPIRSAHQPAATPLSTSSQRFIKTSCTPISASKTNLRPVASGSKKPMEWKMLSEVDQIRGGWQSPLNVTGIITRKKSETSEQVSLGTCDFKMTLYINDNSRVTGKDVTCNLFWKTEQQSPPWLKADWKVIFLWDVFKRPSDEYHTQIVGQSGAFRWALWAPGYIGSVERLEVGAWPELDLSLDQREELKQIAQELYQSHLALDLATFDATPPFAPPPTVFKQVCELQNRSFGDVDLCVEVIDLWRDAPGNDRLTVTDYTMNSKLMAPPPSFAYNENVQPLAEFHNSNGGHEGNWPTTGKRVMSIYVAQPILVEAWKKLRRDSGNEASHTPTANEFRTMFRGKFFKLSKISLRFGRGNLYGIMENYDVSPPIDEEPGRQQIGFELQDHHVSRVVCLDESDPMVIKMLEAKESYQAEFMVED